ncbi:hypothetical protein Hanom_Chr12g01088161 [Helianthus anomalus]
MEETYWRIRGEDDQCDPEDLYRKFSADPSKFYSLKVFHGGEFSEYPEREYINGKINYVDNVNTKELHFDVLDQITKEIGYSNDDVFF